MRKSVVLIALAVIVTFIQGLAADRTLRFNADGRFKIVQFTDVHFKYGNEASAPALRRIAEVIDAEKPDLVVFTGDVIYAEPADKGMREVLDVVSRKDVPFVVTLGNHDHEQGLDNDALYRIIRSQKGCIQPEGEEYAIEIKGREGDRTEALVYCIDSHWSAQVEKIGGYAWITFDQIKWYRETSEKFRTANGGTPVNALAFFHIPIPEFAEAAADNGAPMIGTRRERPCVPRLNTGLFAAMREQGDVMGIFVGHDHDNDYAVLWHDILLGYGRFTGGNTVYNHLDNGARVIELHEGSRTFDTWIRLSRGRVIDRTAYPASYVRDDWKSRPLPLD